MVKLNFVLRTNEPLKNILFCAKPFFGAMFLSRVKNRGTRTSFRIGSPSFFEGGLL